MLEAANIVVQRVETENDIGRDAFVDIVDGTDVTGGVICIQVKSGRASYFQQGTWVVPGKPADFSLWRESTVPFFGVVHDEKSDALRWVDLSEAAVLARDNYLSPVIPGRFGLLSVPVPDENRLDLDLAAFLTAAEAALRRRSGVPVAALLATDVDLVKSGIMDTFAMGRHDPTALLLLAALVHRLPKEARRNAIGALAMTTSHPDVFWTRDNWIPDNVSRVIQRRVSWTDLDVYALLAEIDEDGIQRGSFGQTVYHVLALDRDLNPKLVRTALNRDQPDRIRLWSAAILLYVAGNDAAAVMDQLLGSDESLNTDDGLFPISHSLREVEHFGHLVESVEEFGYVDFF